MKHKTASGILRRIGGESAEFQALVLEERESMERVTMIFEARRVAGLIACTDKERGRSGALAKTR